MCGKRTAHQNLKIGIKKNSIFVYSMETSAKIKYECIVTVCKKSINSVRFCIIRIFLCFKLNTLSKLSSTICTSFALLKRELAYLFYDTKLILYWKHGPWYGIREPHRDILEQKYLRTACLSRNRHQLKPLNFYGSSRRLVMLRRLRELWSWPLG